MQDGRGARGVAWGPEIFADDLASHVRLQWRHLVARHPSPESATDEILSFFAGALNDPHRRTIVWLALAMAQSQTGQVLPSVRQRALEAIDSGADLDRWEGSPYRAERAQVLSEVKEVLTSVPSAASATWASRSAEESTSSFVAMLPSFVLGALVLVLAESALGVASALYVRIPRRHPGADPTNYLGGSFQSVVWTISHGAVALAVHASLGVALIVATLALALLSYRVRRRSVASGLVVAALLVLAAGFNGASFLDFGQRADALLMVVLGMGAVIAYATVLALLIGQRSTNEH